ncbi:hypothetical protein OG749_02820 [Streptomyces nojiriensis]|uniref:hypothetical protein n=1 Tax=Streptomyces nojiriensis TaxID=66374 RepID=UPI002E187108
MLHRPYAAQRFDRGVQEQRQVPARDAVRAPGRTRQIRIPAGDEVRGGVLVALPRTEQVIQQIGGGRPARRLLRHHDRERLSRITATVANASSTTRATV